MKFLNYKCFKYWIYVLKQEYLNEFKIDEEEIKEFNKQTWVLQESSNKESIKLKSLTFNNEIL